jgi:WD40 repeat protein
VLGKFRGSVQWRTTISDDGRFLYVPGDQNTPYQILNVPTMKPLISTAVDGYVNLSSDQKRIICLSNRGRLTTYSLPSARSQDIPTGLTSGIPKLFMLANGAFGISGYKDSNNDTQSVIQVRSPDGLHILYSIPGCEEGVIDSGRQILVGQHPDGFSSILQVYGAATGKQLYSLDLTTNNLDQPEPLDFADPLARIAFSPDGVHCASATTAGLIGLYDNRSTRHAALEGPVSKDAGAEAGIPMSSLYASNEPRSLGFPLLLSFNGQHYDMQDFNTSANGKIVAVVWVSDGRLEDKIGHTYWHSWDYMLDLRDAHTGKLLRTLMGPGLPGYVDGINIGRFSKPEFSRDGKLVTVADSDAGTIGSADIWQVATGKRIGQISNVCNAPTDTVGNYARGLMSVPPAVAFSPDGKILAVARGDGSVYLYSTTTFLPVAEIGLAANSIASTSREPDRSLNYLSFNQSGSIVFGVPDNTTDVLAFKVPTSIR